MGVFSEIFPSLFRNYSKNKLRARYGYVKDWQEASKDELEQYRRNIEADLSDGDPLLEGMLGRFLIETGEVEEGENILYKLALTGEEQGTISYVSAMNYYFSVKKTKDDRIPNHPWYQKAVKFGRENVKRDYKRANIGLAQLMDIFNETRDIDLYLKKIECYEEIELLYKKAIKKREKNAKRLFVGYLTGLPIETMKWKEADVYTLEAIDEEEQENNRLYYYLRFVQEQYSWEIESELVLEKNLYNDQFPYFDKKKMVNIHLKKALEYQMKYMENPPSERISAALINYRQFESDTCAIIRQAKNDENFQEVSKNFLGKKFSEFYPDFEVTIPYDQLVFEIQQYYLDNKDWLFQNVDFEVSEYFLEQIVFLEKKRTEYFTKKKNGAEALL